MSGYQTRNLVNFESHLDLANYQSTLLYGKTSIIIPQREAVYDSTEGGVTYLAQDLINGYIVRQGLDTSSGPVYIDYIDAASNIIDALQRRIITQSNKYEPLQNGTSFKCKIFCVESTPTLQNDVGINLYGSSGVYVGGYRDGNDPHVCAGATAILTITVTDQARLGPGHTDKVFVCISRCATYLSLPPI